MRWIGFPVNQKTRYEESFRDEIAADKNPEPICHDLRPSSSIWGNGLSVEKKKGAGYLHINIAVLVLTMVMFIISG